MNIDRIYLFELQSVLDNRGSMCIGEYGRHLPFVIKRFFFDYNNSDCHIARGCHANRKSRFVFVCLKGKYIINAFDGYTKKTFILDNPKKALFMDKMIWKDIFPSSQDSILLVLSDKLYDKNEYIKDFATFIAEVRKED